MTAALFPVFRTLAGGSLTQEQVDGTNVILAAPEARGWDRRWLAYSLATAWHETGGRMQPVEENLNYSAAGIVKTFGARRLQGKSPASLERNPEALANTVYGGPWGRENLGNTQPGDGWRFRGRGIGQPTGRDNYRRAGERLGLPLEDHPEIALEPDVSAAILLRGMAEGWFTGRKLPDYFNATTDDPVNARQIVNRMDKADLIAGYHSRIVGALPDAPPAPTPPLGPPVDDQLNGIRSRLVAVEQTLARLAAALEGVR